MRYCRRNRTCSRPDLDISCVSHPLPPFLSPSLSLLSISILLSTFSPNSPKRKESRNSRRFSLSNEFLFHDVSNELYNCEYSFYRQATNSTIPTPRVSTNGKRVGEAEGRAGEETRYPFPPPLILFTGLGPGKGFCPRDTRGKLCGKSSVSCRARARAYYAS